MTRLVVDTTNGSARFVGATEEVIRGPGVVVRDVPSRRLAKARKAPFRTRLARQIQQKEAERARAARVRVSAGLPTGTLGLELEDSPRAPTQATLIAARERARRERIEEVRNRAKRQRAREIARAKRAFKVARSLGSRRKRKRLQRAAKRRLRAVGKRVKTRVRQEAKQFGQRVVQDLVGSIFG